MEWMINWEDLITIKLILIKMKKKSKPYIVFLALMIIYVDIHKFNMEESQRQFLIKIWAISQVFILIKLLQLQN